MKRILFLVSATLSFSALAQFPQKLSIGLQGGRTTPKGIEVTGEQPNNFKVILDNDFSKGIFLQYELSRNVYVRGTFKKSALDLVYSYQPAINVGNSYGIGLGNKQLELGLGYRKNLYKGLSITSALGATYLDFKRWNLSEQSASDAGSYRITVSVDQVKEKSVLVHGAVGLEYITKRENAFLLELAYYKGFSDVLRFNFRINAETDQPPYQLQYEPVLKTKGDYLEFRLGYRMPLQKFVNLYSAIKDPKPKPEPEPDYLQQIRFVGRYWGLELGRQESYSQQKQAFPEHTISMRPSHITPSLTCFQGYQFKNRLMLEGGLRFGASSVTVDATETLGMGGSWSLLTFTTPLSVKYALPVWRGRIHLLPETGLWLSYLYQADEGNGYSAPNKMGPYSNIVSHYKSFGVDYNAGYHGGLSIYGSVGKSSELGIGYRFSDNFSKKPFGLHAITYDYNGTMQPAIVSTSRLQNSALSISYRRFFRKK